MEKDFQKIVKYSLKGYESMEKFFQIMTEERIENFMNQKDLLDRTDEYLEDKFKIKRTNIWSFAKEKGIFTVKLEGTLDAEYFDTWLSLMGLDEGKWNIKDEGRKKDQQLRIWLDAGVDSSFFNILGRGKPLYGLDYVIAVTLYSTKDKSNQIQKELPTFDNWLSIAGYPLTAKGLNRMMNHYKFKDIEFSWSKKDSLEAILQTMEVNGDTWGFQIGETNDEKINEREKYKAKAYSKVLGTKGADKKIKEYLTKIQAWQNGNKTIKIDPKYAIKSQGLQRSEKEAFATLS